MKTIEKLCKNKDISDLIYQNVHSLFMKELNNEYQSLSKIPYKYKESDEDNAYADGFPLFYEDTNNLYCFNWRTVLLHGFASGFTDCNVIYHISHKDHSFRQTEFKLPKNIEYHLIGG
jgi:hypothetical protein